MGTATDIHRRGYGSSSSNLFKVMKEIWTEGQLVSLKSQLQEWMRKTTLPVKPPFNELIESEQVDRLYHVVFPHKRKPQFRWLTTPKPWLANHQQPPQLSGWVCGKIYRKAPYLMGKTMVSCRFSLKPLHWNWLTIMFSFFLNSLKQSPFSLPWKVAVSTITIWTVKGDSSKWSLNNWRDWYHQVFGSLFLEKSTRPRCLHFLALFCSYDNFGHVIVNQRMSSPQKVNHPLSLINISMTVPIQLWLDVLQLSTILRINT